MTTGSIAGIDVHKRVLMVVIGNTKPGQEGMTFQRRRFGTTVPELMHVAAWLQQEGVEEAVMESTAQYWKPVWLSLEPHFRLRLAQAWSNRAPRGKKTDFKDAERLARGYIAGELTMSLVPDAEQRIMRSLTRRRKQLTRDRVRIQNQVESLLEETRLKLSSAVTDLFGASGRRILEAVIAGENDPVKLAGLADERVKRSREELFEALTGVVGPIHRQLLRQFWDQLRLVDRQIEELTQMAADAMREHGGAITRLAKIPGIRVLAAQQILSEAGPRASAFPSAAQFSSWIGVCPGRQESAERNHSSRCAKGNMYLRAVLCQAAQAAVRTKNSFFQQKFQRLIGRLGYSQAIWAIARHMSVVIWKVLHDGVEYIERGLTTSPQAMKRRLQRVKQELRALGYTADLTLLHPHAPGL